MAEAPRWTPEQDDAITARDGNLLVAAAAGAGKTATLVERLIRRITDPADPVDVDRLLVVTFTEAAAAEMRERIAAALQAALAAEPENTRLQRQLLLLGRAAISTLHSFCLGLVRQHFYRLGLDPAVTVMSEHEALLLRREVLDALFAERFDAGGEDGPFMALVERYGGQGDEGLQELVLAVHDHVQSLPWPDLWLDRAAAAFAVAADTPVEELPWWEPLRRQMALQLDRAEECLALALAGAGAPHGPAAYMATLSSEHGAVAAAAAVARRPVSTWDEVAAAVAAVAFGRLPQQRGAAGDGADALAAAAARKRVQGWRDEAKALVKGLRETFFHRRASEWLADLAALAPHMAALVGLVRDFGAAFRAAKDAQAALDFNDLERFCLQLLLDPAAPPGELRPSDVARELRDRFAEVLVDEYQDINGVQDAILALAARDDNRFMVGDVKQSIYRFRQTDPSLFLAKYQAYGAGRQGRRIVLGANFRSRAGVVDAVNFLFRQILTASVGELDYDRDAELVCRADYPPLPGEAVPGEAPGGTPPGGGSPGAPRPDGGSAVEVHLLDRDPGLADGAGSDGEGNGDSGGDGVAGPAATGEGSGNGDRPGTATGDDDAGSDGADALAALADWSALEREAALVAQRVRELVHGTPGHPPVQVWDRVLGGYRPAAWRDVVILLRATRGRVPAFVEALGRAGIPAYAQSNTGYFAATEVEVFLSLLQLLDNPRQDIPLAAVLRSPLLGLAAADLARIRAACPGGSFYDAVAAAAGGGAGPGPGAPGSGAPDSSPGAPATPGPDAAAAPTVPPGLSATLHGFLAKLDAWRTLARRQPLSEVIWQIYQDTGFLHYAGGMPGGRQRHANLLALYDRARQFDRFARQGLFRFLRFIERLREHEADLGAAPAAGEGEDVVRVISIHRSKGLEFPIVVVADLGKAFARQDLHGNLLLHRDLGFGPQVIDPDLRVRYPTLAYHAVRESTRLAALAEEMRILYVALTRARERLILVGSCADLAGCCRRWSLAAGHTGWPLPDASLAGARTYLDWIGPALARHRDGWPLRRDPGDPGGPAGSADPAGAADPADPAPADAAATAAADEAPADTAATAAADEAPADTAVAADPSTWVVRIWTAADLAGVLAAVPDSGGAADGLDWARMARGEPLNRAVTSTVTGTLAERFSWRYPYADLARRYAKQTVTELKGHFDPDAGGVPGGGDLAPSAGAPAPGGGDLAPSAGAPAPGAGDAGGSPTFGEAPRLAYAAGHLESRPRFLQETRELTPTEFGTLMHLVMQHLDLSRPLDAVDIAAQVEGMVARELLTPTQAGAVDLAAVASFFATPLGQRIRRAGPGVRREVSFTLALPAAEVYPDLDAAGAQTHATGETVIVQGMIDLLFDEPHGFVLVDFKTDRRDPDAAALQYRGQVALYRRAVADILGRPVAEAYLYFLSAGRLVAV